VNETITASEAPPQPSITLTISPAGELKVDALGFPDGWVIVAVLLSAVTAILSKLKADVTQDAPRVLRVPAGTTLTTRNRG